MGLPRVRPNCGVTHYAPNCGVIQVSPTVEPPNKNPTVGLYRNQLWGIQNHPLLWGPSTLANPGLTSDVDLIYTHLDETFYHSIRSTSMSLWNCCEPMKHSVFSPWSNRPSLNGITSHDLINDASLFSSENNSG